jgi:aerobic carbon-monoxide dehydrogenase medium subunit
VKPAPFEYVRPAEVEEAVQALADGDAKVLAGGQSLLPIMSMRLASPTRIVDINRLPELDRISVDDDGVRIGALVRHRALELDDAACQANPLLRRALSHVAHPTIRNRGTTVGSLVHADPAAEMPAVLALLDGTVEVVSASGSRAIAATDFFIGPLESALSANELAVSASFPRLGPGAGAAWVELARRHGDYAIVGVGALVVVEDTTPSSAKVVLIGVDATPLVIDLDDVLPDAPAETADWSDAVEHLRSSIEPEGDIHATADYRRHLAGVLSRRALQSAVADVGERTAA